MTGEVDKVSEKVQACLLTIVTRIGHPVEYGIEHIHVTLTIHHEILLEDADETADVNAHLDGTQMMYDDLCQVGHKSCSC